MLSSKIEEIRGESSVSDVTVLDLQGCEATNLEGLTDDYENLASLSLGQNKLQSLKAFPSFKCLATLNLKGNKLQGGLEHIAGCHSLKTIDLSDNEFSTLEQLEPLKNLTSLQSLKLSGCPITHAADYKNGVFDLLPQLTEIDGTTRCASDNAECENGNKNGSHNGTHVAAINGEGDHTHDDAGVDQLLRDDLEDDDEEYCPEGEEEDDDIDDDDDDEEEDGEGEEEDDAPAEARGVKRKHEDESHVPQTDDNPTNGSA